MKYMRETHSDYGMKHRRQHFLNRIMDVFYDDDYCRRDDLIKLLDIDNKTIEEIIGDDRDLLSVANAIEIVKKIIINNKK